MPKAKPSSKATDNVSLSFGLASIPITLYSGVVSDHGVKRSTFVEVPLLDDKQQPVMKEVPVLDINGDPEKNDDGTPKMEKRPVVVDHPVGNRSYDKVTDETLETGTPTVRKIETEHGYVFVDEHEEERLFELPPKSLQVKEFQPQHVWYQGNYVPKRVMYIEAAKEKTGSKKAANPVTEKLLAILFESMRKEGAVAVVELTTRGKPKPAVLLPDGRLWEVYPTDAIREQRPLPEVNLDNALVEQGRQLVKTLWSDDPLDLSDERSALIQEFAEKKAANGDFGRSDDTFTEPEVKVDDTSDLMALLGASVEQAKANRKAE